jgi:hypothetical protein
MKSFFIAPPVGGGRSRKHNDPPLVALRDRRCSSECEVTPLGIGIQAIQLFAPSRGSCGTAPSASSSGSCFSGMPFPLQLSLSGKPDDPGTFLRVPPDCVRDSVPRSAAHSYPSSDSSLGSFLSCEAHPASPAPIVMGGEPCWDRPWGSRDDKVSYMGDVLRAFGQNEEKALKASCFRHFVRTLL